MDLLTHHNQFTPTFVRGSDGSEPCAMLSGYRCERGNNGNEHTATKAIFRRDTLSKISNSAVRIPCVADIRIHDWTVIFLRALAMNFDWLPSVFLIPS